MEVELLRARGRPARALRVRTFALLLTFWCMAVPPIYAANGVSIFIPPVVGEGQSREDNTFFSQMLAMEVGARNYGLADTPGESQYSLIGNLIHSGGDDAPHSLHLALVRAEDDAVIVEQDLVYGALEETNEYLPLLVFTMLANISVPEAEPTPAAVIDNAWQRKWFYVGAGAIWTPRVYEGEFQSASLYNFGGGVFLEWRDLNILSISAGAEVVQDWIAISAANQKEVKGFVLELPVLVKLVFRPSRYFMLEPYGGVQLNLPLGGDGQVPPFFSITAGLQYCAKAGPGAFFIDGRAAVDMGKSMLEPADSRGFQRFAIKLGVGYKFGFLGQKQRGGE